MPTRTNPRPKLKGCRRHQYEFRFGVMTSPACQNCGHIPKCDVNLVEPKGYRAIATHNDCPADCSCSYLCPTIEWQIIKKVGKGQILIKGE